MIMQIRGRATTSEINTMQSPNHLANREDLLGDPDTFIYDGPIPSPEIVHENTSRRHVCIDVERMLVHVERSIYLDSVRRKSSITPIYLLYKSNPGVYAKMLNVAEKGESQTKIIANEKVKRHKRTDVNMKSVNINSSTKFFPPVYNTKSFGSQDRALLKRKFFHKSQKDVTSIESEKTPSISCRQKEQSNKNEPNVSQQESTKNEKIHLPLIPSKVSGFEIDSSLSTHQTGDNISLDNSGGNLNTEERKLLEKLKKQIPNTLSKWITEFPEHQLAKFSGNKTAISDRTGTYYKNVFEDRNKEKLVCVPKPEPLPEIVKKYNELRSKNLSKPQSEISIDREKYKLKQKSLLQLKMFDKESKEITRSEDNFRTKPLMPLNVGNVHSEKLKDALKTMSTDDIQSRKGVKSVDIVNFAVNAYVNNPNTKFHFASLPDLLQEDSSTDVVDSALSSRAHHFPPNSKEENELPIPFASQPTVLNLQINTEHRLKHNKTVEFTNMLAAKLSQRANQDKDIDQNDVESFKNPNKLPNVAMTHRLNKINIFGSGRPVPPTPIEKRRRPNEIYKFDLNMFEPGDPNQFEGLTMKTKISDMKEMAQKSRCVCLATAPRTQPLKSPFKVQKRIKMRPLRKIEMPKQILEPDTSESVHSDQTYTMTPASQNRPQNISRPRSTPNPYSRQPSKNSFRNDRKLTYDQEVKTPVKQIWCKNCGEECHNLHCRTVSV